MFYKLNKSKLRSIIYWVMDSELIDIHGIRKAVLYGLQLNLPPINKLFPFPSQTCLTICICLKLLPVIFKTFKHKMKNKWPSFSNTLQLVPDLFFNLFRWVCRAVQSFHNFWSHRAFTKCKWPNVSGSHSCHLDIRPGRLYLSAWARKSNPVKQYLSQLQGS